jgi:hypothetical protein
MSREKEIRWLKMAAAVFLSILAAGVVLLIETMTLN